MQNVNPIATTSEEEFIVGESDFRYFNDRPRRCESGAILYCMEGCAMVSVNMHQGDVHPHTLILLMPGSILMLGDISESFRMSYCAFSSDLFAETVFRLEPSFFKFLGENPISESVGEATRGVESWIQIAAYTYADRENMFRKTIIRNRLQNILLEIYDKAQRRMGYVAEPETGRRLELFKKFITSVREQCTEHREVSYYADILCISTRYLSSIVRGVTHRSPKEVIDEFVILEIKVLLQSTDLTAQEIAYRLHFPDQSYLGHYFRRHAGCSPSAYRSRR